MQRLRGLRRRLLRDQVLKRTYEQEMKKLLELNYAEPVPEDERRRNDGKVWYLPHHPVMNTNKPGKVRIVFDCAATFSEVSLNQRVMQGPDLTNKLLGVLLRFRQEEVAIMADVNAMFHQIRVPKEDRDVLRFLWWPDDNMESRPREFRMGVHLLSPTSPLSSSHKDCYTCWNADTSFQTISFFTF